MQTAMLSSRRIATRWPAWTRRAGAAASQGRAGGQAGALHVMIGVWKTRRSVLFSVCRNANCK